MPLSKSDVVAAQDAFLRYHADHTGSDIIRSTELRHSQRLSSFTRGSVWLKMEIQQRVKSFKIRGAFYKILRLIAQNPQKDFGVVCASAGNHAQGVALSCETLDIKGVIFMPLGTPDVKVSATRKFGGDNIEIRLVGKNYDESKALSKEFAEGKGMIYVDAFDDEDVIAGQGTIGLEILSQMDTPPDYIFAPVGGGGLAAGLVLATQDTAVKIIGVEQQGSESMSLARKTGEPVMLVEVDKFSDGGAVARAGKRTFEIIHGVKVPIIVVPKNRLATSVWNLHTLDSIEVETTAGLAVAGLGSRLEQLGDKSCVSVLTGANIGAEKMDEVRDRSARYLCQKRRYFIPKEHMKSVRELFQRHDSTRFLLDSINMRYLFSGNASGDTGEFRCIGNASDTESDDVLWTEERGSVQSDLGKITFRYPFESGTESLAGKDVPSDQVYGVFEVECPGPKGYLRLDWMEEKIRKLLKQRKCLHPLAVGYILPKE